MVKIKATPVHLTAADIRASVKAAQVTVRPKPPVVVYSSAPLNSAPVISTAILPAKDKAGSGAIFHQGGDVRPSPSDSISVTLREREASNPVKYAADLAAMKSHWITQRNSSPPQARYTLWTMIPQAMRDRMPELAPDTSGGIHMPSRGQVIHDLTKAVIVVGAVVGAAAAAEYFASSSAAIPAAAATTAPTSLATTAAVSGGGLSVVGVTTGVTTAATTIGSVTALAGGLIPKKAEDIPADSAPISDGEPITLAVIADYPLALIETFYDTLLGR